MVRITAVLIALLTLAACNRGQQNNEAVRQAVIDRLNKMQMNVSQLDVTVSAVKFNGDKAEATVSIVPKGGNAAQGMSLPYRLELQSGKWVVTGTTDTSHGATMPPAAGGAMPPATPGSENPHGAGAPAGGVSKMPSPEDLPPAGQKKK